MDESQWTLGVGDGQGGLACCDLRGRKESDTAERLIWSDLNATFKSIKAFSDQHKEFLLSVSSLVQGRELMEGKPFLTLLSGKK